MEIKIKLSNTEHKDLLSYCNLNDLLVSSVVKDSFTTGFNIERYGLLNAGVETKEKEVIKEVIKYVEVPVVEEKEVVKIEYVEVEKRVEVPVEKVVEKIVEVVKEVPVDRVVIQEKTVEVIKNNYNLDEPYLKKFFHYEPSTYHLHIHFVNSTCHDSRSSVEYSHLLDTIIFNLELDDYYYQKIILKIENKNIQ